MPFLDPTQDLPLARAPQGVEPPLPPTPSIGETFAAGFGQDNPTVNFYRRMHDEQFPVEPDHNPMDLIKGTDYESFHRDNFVGSRSTAETRAIMGRIDQEDADRKTLAASGLAGFVAQVLAGIIDPTIALPGGAVVRSVKGGYSVGRSARSVGIAAGAQSAAQEVALQGLQETRTAGESLLNVGSATILGAILGTGAAKLLSRAERVALERSLDADRAAMDAHAGNPPPRSGGAAATNEQPMGLPAGTVQEGTAYRLPIRDAAGVEVGDLKFDIQDGEAGNVVKVLGVGVGDAAARGKGYAVKAYQDLADYALSTGRELWSDRSVSPEAMRVYDALERRGYKVERIAPEQVESIYDPAFKVTGGPSHAAPHPDLPLGDALRATNDLRAADVNWSTEDRAILGEMMSAVRGAAAKRQLSIEDGVVHQGDRFAKAPLAETPRADPAAVVEHAWVEADRDLGRAQTAMARIDEVRARHPELSEKIDALVNAVDQALTERGIKRAVAERVKSAAVELDGQIYTGATHADAMEAASSATGKSIDELWSLRSEASGQGLKPDGFITDTGRFISRAEATEIANRADQIDKSRPHYIEGRNLTAEFLKTDSPGGGSMGAAASDVRQLEMVPSLPGTAGISVTRRTMEAKSVDARRTMADLAEMPYRFRESEAGVAATQGPAVDRLARMEINGTRVGISDELVRQYGDYRFGKSDMMVPGLRDRIGRLTGREDDGKMSFHDFKREVSFAMQNEDRHAIRQVSDAAVYIRDKLFDKWGERAEGAIESFERNVPKEGESYFPHSWNKQLITARRPEFTNRLVERYAADQETKRAAQQRLEWMNGQLQSWQDQIAKLEARFGRAEERAKAIDARAAERSRDDVPKTAGMNEPPPTGRTAELQVRKAVLEAEAKDLADAADLIEELVRQNPQLEVPLQKTVRAIEVKGRKIDITSAKHAEAGMAAKRSEKRLATLEEQLSKTEERQQLIEDYLVVAQQMHDEVRTKIEAEIGSWEGKSSIEAKSALKAREKYIADTGRAADAPRLRSADTAVDRTVKHILASNRDLSVQEIRSVAAETVQRILGSPDGRLPYDVHAGGPRIGISDGSPPPRGALAARQLDVSNAWARDWIENDIEHVVAMHARTVIPDVLLAEKFGDVEMSQAFRKINESYASLIDATKSEKESTRLGNELRSVQRDVAAVRDRVRGVYGWSTDLQNMARIANAAKAVNNMTSMGVATVSSLSDMAGAVIRWGVTGAIRDGWAPFFRGMTGGTEEWGKFKTQMRAIGIGVETAINARQHALDDVVDVYRPQSRIERTLQAASDKFFIANLLGPFTDTVKLISAHAAVSEILRASKLATDGKATKRQIGNLAESGIDQQMAGRIWQQFVQGGEIRDGVHLPNTKDWLDQTAADALHGAVARETDIAVVTPGQEKPLWMSKPVISLLGQFKSFTAASTERLIIANLQRRDASALTGLVFSLGLGMLSYKLNSFFGGVKTSDRPQDWVKEGSSRAGLLGWFEDGNALASKMTRGSVDVYRLIGADKQLSRFASRGATDMLLGPTWGKIENLRAATSSAFGKDWSAADTAAVRRLMPFQNLFYLRGLFNQVEAATNSHFNIPERKEPPTRH